MSIYLFSELCKYYWFDLPGKSQKMGLGPTYIPLIFESDLDHFIQKQLSRFSHLLNILCVGGGMCSLSTLVNVLFHRGSIGNSLFLNLKSCFKS